MSKSKNSHFKLEDRVNIAALLDMCYSFRRIARIIGSSISAISNEIKNHRILKGSLYFGNSKRTLCDRLLKAPFVCNGCPSKPNCKKVKYIYDPYTADQKYKDQLSNSRKHIHCSKDNLDFLNRKLTPLIKTKKQGIDHIFNSNEIGISKSTLYRYIDDGLLEVKNIDLKRKVTYIPRKQENAEPKRVKQSKTDRKYIDFLTYVDLHPKARIVELDTVVGKRDEGYCIFTLIFRKSNFMLGFFLEKHDAQSIVSCIDYLERKLGKGKFMTLFNVCLADNGSEFDYVDLIEANNRKVKRCNLFFCDPMASGQKGKLEKNHEFIRYFYPKGTSFSDLNQEIIIEMFSNINSVKRDYLNGKSPFELLSKSERKAIEKLGYHEINAKDVVLCKTELLKNIKK